MNEVLVFSDNDFGSAIEGLSIERVRVDRSSRVMGSPVETGQQSFDNKCIEPVKITVTGYLDSYDLSDAEFSAARKRINEMYLNRDFKFYSVSTRDGGYNNLILQNSPHDEDPEHFNLIKYELVFVEAMLVQGSEDTPANAENSNTKQIGYQEAKRVQLFG